MTCLLRPQALDCLTLLARKSSANVSGDEDIYLVDSDGNPLLDSNGDYLLATTQLFVLADGSRFSTTDGILYGVPA